MYAYHFLLAAIGFVLLSVFVFLNYPLVWRKDRLFLVILAMWHVLGTVCLILVFTSYNAIPALNLQHEVCRTATIFYISTLLLALFFLFRIIYSRTYRFILRRTGRKAGPASKRFSDRRTQTVLFILLSFGIAMAGYFNVDYLYLKTYDVDVKANSAESELRICLIADIHAGSGTWTYNYDDLAKQIDNCESDVLLIAGDLFDETTGEKDVENFVWVLNTIQRPRYGIYYVYGNHDGLMEDWIPGAKEAVLDAGVTVLADEMTILGEDIQLIGCLDPNLQAENINTLMERLHPDQDKPIIVMTHRPKNLRRMASLGADLAVAGHTHGFNIPQFFATSLTNDMINGIRSYDDMTAITTSGVGAWGFHYKWPAQSEVVCIRVHFTGTEE